MGDKSTFNQRELGVIGQEPETIEATAGKSGTTLDGPMFHAASLLDLVASDALL
jgi:hypothetical protein